MASIESEDAGSSMVASQSDAINGPNDSALMNKPKRPSRRGTVFCAWSFEVTLNADLSQGTSIQHKASISGQIFDVWPYVRSRSKNY